jgi:SAM-dependent methyltransferase
MRKGSVPSPCLKSGGSTVQTAVERWKTMLNLRAQQMDAAYARLGRTSADFWDRRARRFHSTTKDAVMHDPLLHRLQDVITAQTDVLDVGAGTGRFSLALAPSARHITAVEPNAAMLGYLRHDADGQGHVLYPIVDIEPFLAKLTKATGHMCYIYMRATSIDALTGHLWKHFHGDERCLPPGYIHALDVLYEMGIYTDVEVVKLPVILSYASLDVAVEEVSEQLILPDNNATRKELRQLLEDWLVERNGMLVPPVEAMIGAIITVKK